MSNSVSETTILHWLWLQAIDGQGGPLSEHLLPAFRYDVDSIYEADAETLAASLPDSCKLSEKQLRALTDKDTSEALKIRAYCRNEGITLLTPDHVDYPPLLREIQRPPLVLYLIGTLPDPNRFLYVAIVGTRSMSDYGSESAYSFSYDMSRTGVIVVSGMAKGIDGIAHRACLDAGGRTVAVLGCGVDICYPKEHQALRQEILERGGAILSEYPPFSPPNARHFPVRNRIISGLCRATLVVEAGEKSGALITAHTALVQGRSLYAVPGRIRDTKGMGTNYLLQAGAELVTEASNILVRFTGEYPSIQLTHLPCPGVTAKSGRAPARTAAAPTDRTYVEIDRVLARQPKTAPSDRIPAPSPEPIELPVLLPPDEIADRAPSPAPVSEPAPPLTEAERAVYDRIPASGSINVDRLASGSGDIRDLLNTLIMLEIKGLVQSLPGNFYSRL